jgi:hypothetical protein
MTTKPIARGPKWLQAYLNSLLEDVKTAQPISGNHIKVHAEPGKGTVIDAIVPKPPTT